MLGEGMYSVFLVEPGEQLDQVDRICWALFDSDQAHKDRPGQQATVLPQRVGYYLTDAEAKALVSDLNRIGASAVTLEHAAANALASRHAIVLEDAGPNRMAVLKAVRSVSGLDLGQTKALLDALPATVATNLEPRQAANAALELQACGARVSVTGVEELRASLTPDSTPAQSPATGQSFCTHCGTPATSGANFCGSCGTALGGVSVHDDLEGMSAGWRLAREGRWIQARETLQQEAAGGSGESAILLVVDSQERGDFAGAQTWLDRAFDLGLRKFDRSLVEREPDLNAIDRYWRYGPARSREYIYEPHLVLGDSARSIGLTSTAQHWYMHAMAQGSAEAFDLLAETHRELGHEEEAAFWDYEARCAHGDLEIVLERIQAAQSVHDYGQAKQWIERSLFMGNPQVAAQLIDNDDRQVRHREATSPARDNRLAQDIEAIFIDPALVNLMLRGFGVTSGVNKDEVVSTYLVSPKLADYPTAEEYLVVTKERVGLFRKGGFMREEVALAFAKDAVIDIGLGDSNHYEMSGFVGRGTDYLTLTLSLANGSSYTRHMFLGHSEAQINERLRDIKVFIDALLANDWPISEGPGYRSEGGYQRTFSYGFGVWF